MADPTLLVYLDSAVINDVADGRRYPAHAVDALRAAMREAGAALALSLAHVWDFTRGTDEATRRRVSAAVGSFPRVVKLAEDPTAGERENLGLFGALEDWRRAPDQLLPREVRALPVADFGAEVLGNPQMVALAERLVSASMRMTDAERLSRSAERADAAARDAGGAAAGPDRALAAQLFATLARGGSASDALALLRARIESQPPEERARGEAEWPRTEAQVNALWAMQAPHVGRLRELLDEQGLTPEAAAGLLLKKSGLPSIGFVGANIRGDAARRAEVMAWLSPGLALTVALAGHNAKNVTRDPRYSDRADLAHVTYIPYVDLATVDAANFGALARLRKSLRCPRSAVLERNPPGGEGAAASLEALAAGIRRLGATREP